MDGEHLPPPKEEVVVFVVAAAVMVAQVVQACLHQQSCVDGPVDLDASIFCSGLRFWA